MRFDIEQTSPSKISNGDLEYNMGRFGYTELGPQIQQGTDYSIELIIASILMGEDARRTAAIPIVLAKNRANYELLAFLSYRHGFAETLLGTFIALNTILPSPGLPDTIAAMREAGTRPIQLDQNRIRELMRQYGVGPR
ncbi:MAG: hypothetical protein HY296_04375 [Thaumarchaeota archaeon]|nr:hypothetical protein [Nitrososphaerota archaeon]